MKANELMIGDWYAFRGHPYQCTASDIASIAECEEKGAPTDISEIPLTPEILEKNGFKKYSDTLYGLVENFTIEIRLWDDILIRVGEKYDSTFQVGYNWFVNGLVISDVHELQHCLKLVGIDKEIVL